MAVPLAVALTALTIAGVGAPKSANAGWTMFRVPVGEFPIEAILSPDESTAYVANYLAGTISVIDTLRGTNTGEIQLTGVVRGIALSSDGTKLYAGVQQDAQGPRDYSERIDVVSVRDRQVTLTIDLPDISSIAELVLSPDDGTLYVVPFGERQLQVLDLTSGGQPSARELQNVQLPNGESFQTGTSATVSTDGKVLYIGGWVSKNGLTNSRNAVAAITTDSFTLSSLIIGDTTSGTVSLSLAPDDSELFAVRLFDQRVSAIQTDGFTRRDLALTGTIPADVLSAQTSSGLMVFVVNAKPSTIEVLNAVTGDLQEEISWQGNPTGAKAAITRNGQVLYTPVDGDPGTLVAISTPPSPPASITVRCSKTKERGRWNIACQGKTTSLPIGQMLYVSTRTSKAQGWISVPDRRNPSIQTGWQFTWTTSIARAKSVSIKFEAGSTASNIVKLTLR